MLKIWGRTNSINVQKVMWTVGELGLAHERANAGMAHGVVNAAAGIRSDALVVAEHAHDARGDLRLGA